MRHIISQNPQIGRETSEFQRMQIKRKNNEHMIGDTDNSTPSSPLLMGVSVLQWS